MSQATSRPFPSARRGAFLSVLRTADVLRRAAARVLEPYGITPQQYNVLRILRGAGQAGLPTLSIGERLIEETPGMTRLLDRMEAKGFVRRERRGSDRRQVLCAITGRGSALLVRTDPLIDRENERLLANLSVRETAALVRLLDKIRATEEGQGALC